jgi:universal stress protein A
MALAKTMRADLVIEHVLVPPTPVVSDVGVFPQAYEELQAEMRAQATKNLRGLLAKARKAGVRATALLVRGVPDREIVRTARSKKSDLVVLGTHGRTGFTRLLLGSVASRVVATAPCPVLTVRSDRSRRR